MKLSRRQFLQSGLIGGAMAATPAALWASERRPLLIPPLMDVGRGRPVALDFRAAQTQLLTHKLVDVWGVNGRYLAPTVRVKSGDFVKLNYSNNLPQPLSVNLQGVLADTAQSGGSLRQLAPKASWAPIVSIKQPACTAYYHAASLFNSAYQVYRGIAGMWIIEDEQSKKARLPNKYGVNDIPLILQDLQLNSQGVQLFHTQQAQFLGNRLFVNGQQSPYLNVDRGWIRLRLVNASLSRHYDLRLDNGKPLYCIANGLGLLPKMIETAQIRLAPMERVELLVDLTQGDTVSLIDGEPRNWLDNVTQFFADDNRLMDNVILELRPQGLISVFNEPPQLPSITRETDLNVSQTRQFTLRPLDYSINQQRFDPKRVDFQAKLNSVERWTLTSNTPIAFNLQGAQCMVEARGQTKTAQADWAWNDSVWLDANQSVTLLVKFPHSATVEQPFTFGVSDLMLRDKGCMGQFTVA